MKRHISLFVFFCLPGVFLAGCSDADRSSLMGEEEVPVELSALEGDVSSRAAVSAGSKPQAEFEAAMVFSRTGGDYTTPVVAAEEGVWKGTVGINGEVSWGNAGKDAPIYPRWGAWLYLVSYAPYAEPDKAASGSGTGTYAGTVSLRFSDTGKPLGGRALSFTGVRPSIDATLFSSEEDASKRGVGMGEEYHGEGGETACFVEAGYGRGDILHHNRTSPGTDGGSYAERNQRSRARNGSDRPDSGICGATFTPSVGSRRKQWQWRRKQHVYAESRNINRYIR